MVTSDLEALQHRKFTQNCLRGEIHQFLNLSFNIFTNRITVVLPAEKKTKYSSFFGGTTLSKGLEAKENILANTWIDYILVPTACLSFAARGKYLKKMILSKHEFSILYSAHIPSVRKTKDLCLELYAGNVWNFKYGLWSAVKFWTLI